MENELRIIAGLNAEQISERAAAVAFELGYWQHVLDDASTVNDGVLTATTAALDATVAALTLMPLIAPEQLPLIQVIVDHQRVALTALKSITDASGATVDLAAGRLEALKPVGRTLRQAAGLDPDGEGGPGA